MIEKKPAAAAPSVSSTKRSHLCVFTKTMGFALLSKQTKNVCSQRAYPDVSSCAQVGLSLEDFGGRVGWASTPGCEEGIRPVGLEGSKAKICKIKKKHTCIIHCRFDSQDGTRSGKNARSCPKARSAGVGKGSASRVNGR